MTTTAATTSTTSAATTEIAAKATLGTAGEDDTASGKTCRATVTDWLPNVPTTLHVYFKGLASESVVISVSSRNDSVPFLITLPFMSNHWIILIAKSVVQLSAARVP